MSTLALPQPTAAWRRLPGLLLLALAGLAVFLLGAFVAPARAWSALLVAAFGATTLALGGAVFVALVHVTGGRWARGILAVPEALAGTLPWVGGLTLLLGVGYGHLYPWADAARVHADAVLGDRAAWMSGAFVLARSVLCLLLWSWAGWRLVLRSRAARAGAGEGAQRAVVRAAAQHLLLFAPSFSLACFDLLLSLEPHWSSTLFALYHFAGLIEAAVAAIVLGVLARRRQGQLEAGPDVLHDLGKLLFAFAFFWGYLWFCQYMLIWYTNMPEEVEPYVLRHAGAWQPLALANVLLNFALPFVLLISRHAKRSAVVLGRVAVVVLLGRLLDLVLAVQPTVLGPVPALGPLDLLVPAGAAAWLCWCWLRTGLAPGAGAATR